MRKTLLAAAALAFVPLLVFAEPLVLQDDEIEIRHKGKTWTVIIPEETLSAAGWQPIPVVDPEPDPVPDPTPDPDPDPDLGLALLDFPAARGEVIFLHNWQASDVPSNLNTASQKASTSWLGERKFRVVNPAGRYLAVADPETGKTVLDILVTRENDAAFGHHHTEIEVHIPDRWTNGRFMVPGQRYLLEVWRKNIGYQPDDGWEIWSQSHSRYDTQEEAARNPTIAIDGGRDGANTLTLRADSDEITLNKDYDRQQTYKIGANTSDVWELWQIELVYDHAGGALHLWRNGELVHSEEGKPVGYNDQRGPPWSFGWYKWFSGVSTAQRHALIGPVRVQLLTGG